MNSEIKYVSFMRSYYDASKVISDKDEKLKFFEAIFDYGFEGIEPDFNDIPLLSGLFTIIKPIIDSNKKTIKRNTENGAKHTSGLSGGLTDGLSGGLLREKERNTNTNTNNNTKKEKETDLSFLTSFLSTTKIDIYEPVETIDFLKSKNLDDGYLFYVLDVLLQKYPKNTDKQLSAMFNKAIKWENLLETYVPKPKEPVEEADDGRPKKCPICHKKLIKNGLNTIICGHCREEGHLVWWEKENNEWIRQDTTSA